MLTVALNRGWVYVEFKSTYIVYFVKKCCDCFFVGFILPFVPPSYQYRFLKSPDHVIIRVSFVITSVTGTTEAAQFPARFRTPETAEH